MEDPISLKQYVDTLFAEKEKQISIATAALDKRLELLNEFRAQSLEEQGKFMTLAEYNAHHERLVEDVKTLQNLAIADRSENIKRSEFESLGNQVANVVGSRTTLLGTAAVVVTLLVAGFTYIVKSQPSSSDISAQIQHEAPWVADKPTIEARLDALERANIKTQLQLSQIQQLDHFFCVTRPKAGLPAC